MAKAFGALGLQSPPAMELTRRLTHSMILCAGLFAGAHTWAAAAGDNVPRTIPLKPGTGHASSDLVRNGQSLSADEADALAAATDLSALEPRAGTDIYPGVRVRPVPLYFEETTPVQFIDNVPTIMGRALFAVSQNTAQGERQFSIAIGVTVRNMLYQKALLEKIGYQIPPAQWARAITLNFASSIEKDSFIRQAFEGTRADPSRWIKSVNDTQVVVQDAVVMERSQNKMYNLSLGYLPADRIGDRRVLRALAVPYEFLNIPENVNLLRWNFGSILSNHILLTFDYSDEFIGNYEDSRWIARKITKLSREDFKQIAAAGHAPADVQALLVEKLIARRNDLLKVFKISAPALDVQSDISRGNTLVKGQINSAQWNGYGTQFASGPSPDSPFASEQMIPFFQSKGVANLISNAVSVFNTSVIPRVDIENKVLEKQWEALADQYINYIKTGQIKKVPVKAFIIPNPTGNIIASRDIVIGSYLGSDNKVQLADTVGANLNLGAYVGVLGIPAPWMVSGGFQASVTRTYTHLRPLSSIKTALNYPFKNAIVPYFQKQLADLIDDLPRAGAAASDAQQAKINTIVGQLKDQLQINESIIVTDTLGPEISATVSYQVAKNAALYAGVAANQIRINRVQIVRTDEDEIQVYRDIANSSGLSVTLGLQNFIPIITLRAAATAGNTQSRLYKVNINPNTAMNPDVVAGLLSLKQILNRQNFEMISILQKPVVLETAFRQDRMDLDFLFVRNAIMESDVKIQASVNKDGRTEKIQLFHSNLQKRTGFDFQNLLLNIINAAISRQLDYNGVSLNSTNNGRPSDTVYGRSVNHQASMDGILQPRGNGYRLLSPFISLNTNWAGWRLSRAGAQDILKEMSEIVGRPLYPPQTFQNAKEIQLYDINFYINIYAPGIEAFLGLTREQVHKILDPLKTAEHVNAYPNTDSLSMNEMDKRLTQVDRYFANAKAARDKGYVAEMSHNLMRLAELVELTAGYRKLAKLFGGEKNVIAGATIRGFRDGEDQAEAPIIANTRGEFGSLQFSGPAEDVRKNIGATTSEFYVEWLLGHL